MRITQEKRAQVEELIDQRVPLQEILRLSGVSSSSVYRIRDEMDKRSSELVSAYRSTISDRTHMLVYRGSSYELETANPYLPAEGHIINTGYPIPELLRLEGNNLHVEVISGIRIDYGPQFSKMLQEYLAFISDTEGMERLQMATLFVNRHFQQERSSHWGIGVVSNEDIIASKKGNCTNLALVLAMLINADESTPEVAMVGSGMNYDHVAGDEYVRVGRGQGHSWVLTSSGIVLDPSMKCVGVPDMRPEMTPSVLLYNNGIRRELFSVQKGEYAYSLPYITRESDRLVYVIERKELILVPQSN